jgi:aspartyl-tRNA(Asn)/glutamyl-tRNA(Gln) amidotransferase subunit A
MLGTYALSSGYYDAYYGRAQKVRTKIAEDFRAAFERFDFVVTPTSPSVAFELGPRPTTRSPCTSTTTARVPMSLAGIPASPCPAACPEPCPSGLQLAAPPSRRTAILDAAHALERAFAFDGRGVGVSTEGVRDGHRAGDPRPARHAHEDVLLLRARVRRAAEHPHVPGLPRACRARCPWPTPRRSTTA